jgi:hypothetical protein
VLIAGCGGDVKAKVAVPAVESAPAGDAGYKAYVWAAESVETRAQKYIGRTAWSPDQRDHIVSSSSDAIRIVAGAESPDFGRTWDNPFGFRKHTRGWRTLGRALAWRAEAAIKNEDYADARYCLSVSLKVANALSGSDAHDAAMGSEILDECMSAIWPALPRFPAGTLQLVSADVRQMLERGPPIEQAVAKERNLMMAQVAWVRDRYQERDFATISETLGESIGPALKFLKELAAAPAEEQRAYFTNFVAEVDADINTYEERLKSAPVEWKDEEKKPTRAWMRFSNSFGTPWRVFVKQRAEVRTRLRLLAIDAALLGMFKASGSVPSNLEGFPASLRSDPYSERNLVFVSRGVDYKLYSVGPNGIDDGGDAGDLSVGR